MDTPFFLMLGASLTSGFDLEEGKNLHDETVALVMMPEGLFTLRQRPSNPSTPHVSGRPDLAHPWPHRPGYFLRSPSDCRASANPAAVTVPPGQGRFREV